MKKLVFLLSLFCFTNTIISQGIWNTPANFGVSNFVTSQLNDVHFIDPTTAIAVGKEGTILKTDDGGLTWRGISSGTQNELTSVDFINSLEGMIMGTFSTFLKTTDGGETWNAVSNLSGSIYFYDIKMISTSEAIAVGLIGNIYKTSNGGLNWSLVPSGTSSSIYGVDFISATEGYAVCSNGIILKTTDAGETWQAQTSVTTNQLNKIKFYSSTFGCAVGFTGTILITNDGGDTWVSQTSGVTTVLNDVEFYSIQEGWAVGNSGTLLHTTDGGNTWVDYSFLTSKTLRGIGFGNATNAIMVGDAGFVANSFDAGNVWDIMLDSDLATTSFNSLSFPNAVNGWVAGSGGKIFATSDNGLNWTPQTSGTTETLFDIHFFDEFYGWACGTNGVVLATIDGGASWNIYSQVGQLNSIYFTNVSNGWVVGNGGVIYQSTDGGLSWTGQTSNTSESLNGCFFIDNTNGWAVGNNGTILHTLDGGSNWTAQTSGTTENLKDVAFSSSLKGWATGTNGTVLYTDDGGNNWNTQDAQTSLSVNGISFLSQNSAWIGCNNGAVFRTKNKGFNWEYQSSSNNITINDIHMSSFKEGCAVGISGKIVLYRCGTPAPTGNANPSFCFSAKISDIETQEANVIWYDQPTGGNVLAANHPLQDGVTYYGAQNIDDCESVQRLAVTVTILNEGNPIVANITTQPSNCNSSTGSASVAISGGTAPYNYLWDNGSTINQANNLYAGIHYLTIEDNVGCTFLATYQIEAIGAPTITSSVIDNACAGEYNGSIDITVAGGQAPYEYAWSNHNTTEDVANLAYGCYEVKVTDALGCVTSENYFVDEPAPLYINYEINSPTCLGSNGAINIENGGGIAPYNYNWSNGASTMNISTLVGGIYEITVTDNNGCIASKKIILNEIASEYIIPEVINTNDCVNNLASLDLFVSGDNNTYLWSDNSSDKNLLNVPFGEYSLEVTNDAGCKSFANFDLMPQPSIPLELCIVNVDEVTQHNVLIWEKPMSADITSFNIYKESCTQGVYHLIHSQLYADESIFEDSIANADVRGWRYKISTVNSCGIESALSEAHRTIQIMVTQNGSDYDLRWTDYEGVYIFMQDVYRFTTSLGEELVGSFQLGVTNFTTDTPTATDDLIYYVKAEPFFSCTSTKANINTSRSNKKGAVAGVNNIEETLRYSIVVSPVPASDILNIKISENLLNSNITVRDALGKIIVNNTISNIQMSLNISELETGVYFIQIPTEKGMVTKKFVKN
jgi:photosystem II stability/assembly factor-like uncharacterized protein